MLTAMLIVVLVVVGIAALVSVPMMIRSTRRQVVVDAPSGAPRPGLGSPAQVWVDRGERVLGELGDTLGEHAALHHIPTDAAAVVAELRATASQVAEVDRLLARIPVPSLEDELRTLGAALAEAEASGRPAATALSRTHEAVSARLAVAARQGEVRAALLAKMQATVTGLEQARDELAELISSPASAPTTNDDAAAQLTGRLDALREGLVEVRQASYPEIGPGTQGYP